MCYDKAPIPSAPGYCVDRSGNVYTFSRGPCKVLIPMKPRLSRRGYLRLNICSGGRKRTRLVHQLVAETFIPNPEAHREINHKDGDKTNNNYLNLEWVSREENMKHAFSSGLAKPRLQNLVVVKGENNHKSKLLHSEVVLIRLLLEEGVEGVKIASLFMVHPNTINKIKLGYTWRP